MRGRRLQLWLRLQVQSCRAGHCRAHLAAAVDAGHHHVGRQASRAGYDTDGRRQTGWQGLQKRNAAHTGCELNLLGLRLAWRGRYGHGRNDHDVGRGRGGHHLARAEVLACNVLSTSRRPSRTTKRDTYI